MRGIRAVAAVGAVLLCAGTASDNLADTLRSTAASYFAKAGQVAAATGRDSTMDYYNRLLQDLDLLKEPPPPYYPADVWQRSIEAQSQLDVSLAAQLISGSYQAMNAIRGAGETFVRSSKDGTMQPVAVYVPFTYSAQRPAPVIVFLHG
ncbi:MAG TPA: hypothetical protein VN909_03220, partial [Candidatus Dormibacteraeota bacterium]|nr:hypothetical protein [Candidatus Dormibacteraeota bacterium]